MRQYLDTITLTKNSRGVWDLDTTKGCGSGMAHNPRGCYGDCYAARDAIRYGIDFSKSILRYFKDESHVNKTVAQINKIDMSFVRMGVTGDPSENWNHTINVCEAISSCDKEVVIITKHWNNLRPLQLERLSKLNVCINTSISALDEITLFNNRLVQYNRLKKYCTSVLRIVSCDFNLNHTAGMGLALIQDNLFLNENILDNVLRINKKNYLVTNGIINIEKVNFLGKHRYASVLNKDTYIGECSKCPEMCGLIYR